MSGLKSRNKLQKNDVSHFVLDVTGLVCPYPQLFAMNALDEIPPGAELEVLLDNPPSVRDIPPALEQKGYTVIDVSRTEGARWKITVKV